MRIVVFCRRTGREASGISKNSVALVVLEIPNGRAVGRMMEANSEYQYTDQNHVPQCIHYIHYSYKYTLLYSVYSYIHYISNIYSIH